MRCALYLTRNTPPFSLIRELRTAGDIDRIRPLDESGTMTFRMSAAEGVALSPGLMTGTALLDGSPLDPDELREGSTVIDWSTEGLPPWLWFVSRIGFDGRAGTVEVQCQEWRHLLDERQVPLNSPAHSRSAAALAILLLQAANSRNPSHITAHIPLGGLYRPLPEETIQYGGMMLGRALGEIARRTNTEWWVDYHIGWGHCQPRLHWGYRRGVDRRGEVQLSEGVHLAAVTYSRDAREVPRVMRFIEGGAETPGQSKAGAVASSTAAVAQNRSADVGLFEAPLEAQRRRALRAQHGPAVQAEVLEVLPQGADDFAMLGAALRRIQTPIVALQSIELLIRARKPLFDVAGVEFLSPPGPAWSAFDLGDTIMVRLSSPHFLAGVDLDVRVTAIQPDEATGELAIVAEVQA